MLINAYCTHREPPPLAFPHTLHNRRDASDPELADHLGGFMGFVMEGGKRPMTAMRYGVIRHIERVRHHLSFEVESSEVAALEEWGFEANAVFFLPDGTVRAPNGAVLVDPDTGEPGPDAEIPHPLGARKRKEEIDTRLAELAIEVPPFLPPVVDEVEVELRETSDVVARCFALFACAVRAESLATNKEIGSEELEKSIPRAVAAFSDDERAFFYAKAPEKQAIANHGWRYESLNLLAWALGIVSELPLPTRICDVPMLAKAMFANGGQSFADAAHLRPTGEILDALDLHFRLHWATTHARVSKTDVPAGLVPGVVLERHYALNWLVRFENAEWDDVDTPT
ncbi:MAG: DUF4272 domain-containing protein [Deltaproteobacteria bacterium]|nr:DUF4272 domain-containing protein [Deltaproteobacteria bacterium]